MGRKITLRGNWRARGGLGVRTGVVVMAVAGLGLVPTVADATTVNLLRERSLLTPPSLIVLGPAFESRGLRIVNSHLLGSLVIDDARHDPLTPVPGSPCQVTSPYTVHCPAFLSYYVRVGAGPDTVDATLSPPAVGRIYSTGGSDFLAGGSGPEIINGGPGADRLRGNGGNDEIDARNGVADHLIDCGAGVDLARLDAVDPTPIGCETVTRP